MSVALDIECGFGQLISLYTARLADRLDDRFVARPVMVAVAAAVAAAVAVAAAAAVAAIVVCPQELPGVRSSDAGTPQSVRRISHF